MKKFFRSTEKNEEIISLNTDLYDEFFVQELEYRLETDPLMLGGFLLSSVECIGYTECSTHCIGYGNCPDQCLDYMTCKEYNCQTYN
jgi:hypothetical protein